jgi:hypothetical protein
MPLAEVQPNYPDSNQDSVVGTILLTKSSFLIVY